MSLELRCSEFLRRILPDCWDLKNHTAGCCVMFSERWLIFGVEKLYIEYIYILGKNSLFFVGNQNAGGVIICVYLRFDEKDGIWEVDEFSGHFLFFFVSLKVMQPEKIVDFCEDRVRGEEILELHEKVFFRLIIIVIVYIVSRVLLWAFIKIINKKYKSSCQYVINNKFINKRRIRFHWSFILPARKWIYIFYDYTR